MPLANSMSGFNASEGDRRVREQRNQAKWHCLYRAVDKHDKTVRSAIISARSAAPLERSLVLDDFQFSCGPRLVSAKRLQAHQKPTPVGAVHFSALRSLKQVHVAMDHLPAARAIAGDR
jgi:hypothetical protein